VNLEPDGVRDEFASITERSALVEELRRRIDADGPMTFRAFMEAALYHPRYGYYRTSDGVTGRGGDYVTSPEVHPIFGTLVAKQIIEFWAAMGRPATFDVVEAGAGRGLLARDILLRAAEDADFSAAVRYRICEPSELLRDAQRRCLIEAGIDDRSVEWSDVMPAGVRGCIVTNELLDALPVHRVVRRGDELLEVYVAHNGEGFRDEVGPLSDARLRTYFDALGLLPGDGCFAEVNLDAVEWIGSAAAALDEGYVLTFDYGYEARELYAPWRRDGTLLCFYRQSASSDPYQRVGRQDMTASVDFTTLRREGEAAGLHALAMTDQADFLVRMGIGDALTAVMQRERPVIEEYFARRNVVLDLIDPAKLGRIKVLLQAKVRAGAAPSATFTGFVDA
jgi:SAM-dependent MidA family methyltransferase